MKTLLSLFLILCFVSGWSQSLDQLVETALKNNNRIVASQHTLDSRKQLMRSSIDLPKTEVSLLYGQYNSYAANDNNITISQSIPFSVFGSQGALNRAQVISEEKQKNVTENEVILQVKQVYYQLVYAHARHLLLLKQDSIYEGFVKSATLKYQTGESRMLEKSTAEMQRSESLNKIHQSQAQIDNLQKQLEVIINAKVTIGFTEIELKPIFFNSIDTSAYQGNAELGLIRQRIEVARREKNLQASKAAPDLLVGFFSQTLIDVLDENNIPAGHRDRFTGFQIGVALPIWFIPHQARIRSAKFAIRAAESNFNYEKQKAQSELQQAMQQLSAVQNSLTYYSQTATGNADLILKQSQTAFKEGEIGYAEYLLNTRTASEIQEKHLAAINDLNQTVIYIEYLTGKK